MASEFVPDFTFAELSQIKLMATKELSWIMSRRGQSFIEFYRDFVGKVESYKKTGVGISLNPIIPDTIYILATMIYRVDQADQVIKSALGQCKKEGDEDKIPGDMRDKCVVYDVSNCGQGEKCNADCFVPPGTKGDPALGSLDEDRWPK